MEENILKRFRAVAELVERGVGGEKDNAQGRWDAMVEKYGDPGFKPGEKAEAPNQPPPGSRAAGVCPICGAAPFMGHNAHCVFKGSKNDASNGFGKNASDMDLGAMFEEMMRQYRESKEKPDFTARDPYGDKAGERTRAYQDARADREDAFTYGMYGARARSSREDAEFARKARAERPRYSGRGYSDFSFREYDFGFEEPPSHANCRSQTKTAEQVREERAKVERAAYAAFNRAEGDRRVHEAKRWNIADEPPFEYVPFGEKPKRYAKTFQRGYRLDIELTPDDMLKVAEALGWTR